MRILISEMWSHPLIFIVVLNSPSHERCIHPWKVQLAQNLDAVHSAPDLSKRILRHEYNPLQSVLRQLKLIWVQTFTLQYPPYRRLLHTKDMSHTSLNCTGLTWHHIQNFLLHNLSSVRCYATCIRLETEKVSDLHNCEWKHPQIF